MSSEELLFNMGMNALYSTPLILAWMYAVALGGWVVRKSRGAGICLMAAGLLELLALFFGIAATPVTSMLYESQLGFEVINALIFGRAVLRVFVLLISHTLLLMGIYGWRSLGQ